MFDSRLFFDLIPLPTLFLLGALTLFVWLRTWKSSPPREPEVPGPKTLPIIGNYLSPHAVHKQMAAFVKDFGPVFSLQLFATKVVMVNSVSACRELLEARSSIYSHRLPMKMAELCGFHQGILFQQDANKLRQGRRLVSMGLAHRELERYRHVYAEHTVTFLASLLRAPENFLKHVRKLPLGLTLDLAYGYKMKGDDDPFVKRSEEWVSHFASTTSFGDFLVNWFPFLERVPGWVPGTSFQHVANQWKESANDFTWEAFHSVKSAVDKGEAPPSVISRVLTDSPGVYDEDAIAFSAAQIMTGGADTSVNSISTFILSMVLHPEVQEKGREEIDRVIGADRLPNPSDWNNLPYVSSIVRETLRCHPPIPLLMRNPIKDDVYNGYLLPKNTMMIVNYWAMLHNEEVFPDPETFRPERWAELTIDKDNDPLEIAFGFGRRVCPGKAAARELLFLAITSMLATFTISKAKDADGNDITPKEEFTDGGIIGPVPFKCKIEPRSVQAQQLVENAFLALQ